MVAAKAELGHWLRQERTGVRGAVAASTPTRAPAGQLNDNRPTAQVQRVRTPSLPPRPKPG